jgi:hypothetical protein
MNVMRTTSVSPSVRLRPSQTAADAAECVSVFASPVESRDERDADNICITLCMTAPITEHRCFGISKNLVRRCYELALPFARITPWAML